MRVIRICITVTVMTSLAFPQPKIHWVKGSWGKQRLANIRWSGGVGAALTIGIHVVVIALLLAARTPVSSQPVPMNVTVINTMPEQAQQSETLPKPQLQQPTFHVPQPEIAVADSEVPSVVPVATANAVSTAVDPTATLTQPVFDAAYLNNPVPSYPPLARRMREEGVVLVRVLVSSEGLPDQIELKRSSGSARLDAAALTTVKKWRFMPARRGGQTVAAWVVVPIAFSLTA